MGRTMRFLQIVKPLIKVLPEVSKPTVPIPNKEKILWTAIILFLYLICAQVPLYGIVTSKSSDPFYWARVIMASNRGTLMELGISPIITTSMIMQLLAGAKIIEVDVHVAEDRDLFEGTSKIFGLLVTLGQATAYTISGAYGNLEDLGMGNALLIIAQLFCAGIVVLLVDELLQEGYGIGGGISLFIAVNICEQIVWKALSPSTLNTGKGTEFEGAVIALFHLLLTKPDKISALREAFYRPYAPNMTNLLATFLVFVIVIYIQGFRQSIVLSSQNTPGQTTTLPIRLFYTHSYPIILHTALVTHLYFISQKLYMRSKDNFIVNVLGQWAETPGGAKPIGGIAYYIYPPTSFLDIMNDPIRCFAYTTFILASCAFFARVYLTISGQSPNDVARNLVDNKWFIKGTRGSSTIQHLSKPINTAAAFGGICVGALTIIADFLGAIGSGTGTLLAVTTIYRAYEKIMGADFGGPSSSLI